MRGNRIEKALDELSRIMKSPYGNGRADKILEWIEDNGLGFAGGGHNRLVAKIELDGVPLALKIPVRVGGIDDNIVELYNSQYAKALYDKKGSDVGTNISYSDDMQLGQDRPVVLLQEFIYPLHDEAETTSKKGMKALGVLIEHYGAWKELVSALDEYFYIADVDLRKPFNFGIREDNGEQYLVLLDHGMVIPRYEIKGRGLEPIPIQCPNCSAVNTLHYRIPKLLDDELSSNNYLDNKVQKLLESPTEEKHTCDKCGHKVDSVIVFKEVYKALS